MPNCNLALRLRWSPYLLISNKRNPLTNLKEAWKPLSHIDSEIVVFDIEDSVTNNSRHCCTRVENKAFMSVKHEEDNNTMRDIVHEQRPLQECGFRIFHASWLFLERN